MHDSLRLRQLGPFAGAEVLLAFAQQIPRGLAMGRFLLWLFLALLVAAGAWVYFFLVDAGVFLDLKPVSVGVCRQVTAGGVVGIEDIAIDPETKIAYLAGYDRRRAFAMAEDPAHPVKPTDVRGAVWTYDLNTPDAVPSDATTAALPDGFWHSGSIVKLLPRGSHSVGVRRYSDINYNNIE